ncbi:MAG TPA: metallophosphoesterase family protein, partial [Chloroflexota bacterium]|nr:metallophosphoesterase family protein [Chloroflexota bacterium]
MLVAIISDIHSNLAALEAVLADCRDCDRVWCLGDVVGYGPDPIACVERIREVAEICIAGNHDLAAIGSLPIEEFNGLAAEAAIWTSEQLSAGDREFLGERPMVQTRGEFTLTHGSPRDPVWEYLMTAEQARDNFEYFETPVCFVGHSHIPVAFSVAGGAFGGGRNVQIEPTDVAGETSFGTRRHLINVGSVGQPRDGDPRSAFVIVDTENRTYRRRRVRYNVAQTQSRMRSAGLPMPLWS